MKELGLFVFAVLAYLAFVATSVYAAAFFGNFFVARTIDAAAGVPLRQALLVNVGLLLLFALQHSGMARRPFKRWLGSFIARSAVRSIYVLMSCFALVVLMALWQPMGGVVWFVENEVIRTIITMAYAGGWTLMIWATFLIDHFELFGLKQAWCMLRGGTRCEEPAFGTPAAYRIVRHPIYAGWLIVIWASPIMTVTHLVLAAGMTAYTLMGIRLEERDLSKRLRYYEQYCRKVPMLLPSLRRRLRAEASAAKTHP
ncbi:MAG: isoprenylcysteine carboxylmethyltransferase family protein [Gammaproteobacteria bacterium]|nr:isoprenylcysteine carboxylmethyltransferase family protein [Gammaproteobacteria bacterium]